MHAVNPLQRLRLLRLRLDRQRPETMDPEPVFHAEMSQIFHSLRDLHTNYLLPKPYSGKVAFLPFQIEEYEEGSRHYVVSHVVQGFTAPPFGVGVEVTYWNGIPIDRAIELNAARFAGSNPDAQHSRGLQSLTIRPLVIHLPPDEEWVTVSYLATDGSTHTMRHDWVVADNLPPFAGDPDDVSATAATLGLDLDADATGRVKTMLFAPAVAEARRLDRAPALEEEPVAPGEELTTSMPGVFRARSVQTSSGVFGHIRIFTFSVNDPDAFVDEFTRLIGLLPPDGLVVDVRDNGGGHIYASEFTLQTLTPRRIQPEPVQFASRDLNLVICRRHRENPSGIDLGPWFPSLDQAIETGAEYSGAFPITPVDGANARGQQYYGPVVLITNARCYSATDIFAAGFADHQIGTILGVDNNTGAGGANVWTHGLLTQLLQLPTPDPTSPYVALPNGANMRVAIRRTVRVGTRSYGTPVEDIGVVPDELHRMTRRDVLEGNADLLDRAGEILANAQARRLLVVADLEDDTLDVDVETAGIDRIDAYVDDRPRASRDVTDGPTTLTIADVAGAGRVRVDGLTAGVLVASRTVTVGSTG
jgi:C-terminal processing protease CtpA/Prc